jgi:Protein of unknown function (DUF4019)
MSGSHSSSSTTGCGGCLGLLVLLAIVSAFFFGGGLSIRIGQWSFFLGNPTNPNQLADTNPAPDANQAVRIYFKGLENSAKIVNESTRKLRTQFNQGQCQEIYEQSSDILKRNVKQADFINLCNQMKDQFGSLESTELIDWWGQPAEQQGDYILIRYQTKSSKFLVLETFIWQIVDGKPKLVGYLVVPAQASPIPNPLPPSQI